MGLVRYIAFEGIDGCGKSTQVRIVCNALTKVFITPICLAEPTYGEFGLRIRNFIQQGSPISVQEQHELFTQDRRQHVTLKIAPLLQFARQNESFVIVQDRSYLSAPAYQAESKAEMLALLREQQSFAPKPDVVFLLDLPAQVAFERLTKRGLRSRPFERLDFLELARQRYLFLAKETSEHIEVLDAAEPQELIGERVLEILGVSMPEA